MSRARPWMLSNRSDDNRMTVSNGQPQEQRLELRIDDDPIDVSASELAGDRPSSPRIVSAYSSEPLPCVRCSYYYENAKRAYGVVETFSQKLQENTNLHKQIKDLNKILHDRQEFILELQKRLEAEKSRNKELEQTLSDHRVEFGATKEQLEFLKMEAEKNKELADKTVEHEEKITKMSKAVEKTNADHVRLQNQLMFLAKTVANYQKRFGPLNMTQQEMDDDQPSTSQAPTRTSPPLRKTRQSAKKQPDTSTRKTKAKKPSVSSSLTAFSASENDIDASLLLEQLGTSDEEGISANMLLDQLDISDDENPQSPKKTSANVADALSGRLNISVDDEDMPEFTSIPEQEAKKPPAKSSPKTILSKRKASSSKSPSKRSNRKPLVSTSLTIDDAANTGCSIELDKDTENEESTNDKGEPRANASKSSSKSRMSKLKRAVKITPAQSSLERHMKAKMQSKPSTKPKKPATPPSEQEKSKDTQMPPPKKVPNRALKTSPSTRQLRSRSISSNKETVETQPRQLRSRNMSSSSSVSSGVTSSPNVQSKPRTQSKSPRKEARRMAAESLDSDDELVIDDCGHSSQESAILADAVNTTNTRLPKTAEGPLNSETQSKKVPEKRTTERLPSSPRRAMLIDIPVQNPQRRIKTRAQTSASKSRPLFTTPSTKHSSSSFNFIDSLLREITSKKLSMRDGLKRFNAEPQISSLSTEQFADSLCRFIRSENVGDLWFVLMQSAKKQAKEKEALLSKTEKLFFEFVYEVNENNEQRWSEIFMTLARSVCMDCEKSPASSLVQKCRDVRVMLCSLFFSDQQQEEVDSSSRSSCLSQMISLIDGFLDNEDSSTVIKIFCFIFSTNGSFLFDHILCVASDSHQRIKRLQQHLKQATSDANMFFSLLKGNSPDGLVEMLKDDDE